MNVEFKTHQLVVAGMQTQIKLLTSRCIEWQQKLAEAKQQTNTYAKGLDKACALLASIQVTVEGGSLPTAYTPELQEVEKHPLLAKIQTLIAQHDAMFHEVATLQEAAASTAERHEAEIKAIKAKARKRNRNRR